MEGKIPDQIIGLRHELHRLAERSGSERQTAEKVKETLQSFNADKIVENVGGEGIIATYFGEEEGPEVMIRCELDALPIPEENDDIEYKSQNGETGHKCGHDGHMAIVLGIASYLNTHKPRKGNVHLLFQPAEETGQGAGRVLEDEKFKEFEPGFIFALHNLPGYPLNEIVVRNGIFASASRGLEVELKGDTSHAAHPENGRSPALALATLIQNFSSFPQYFSSLDEAAKVTVINARLGEIAFGTTPGYAEFRATLRTHQNELMEELGTRSEKMVEDIARTHDLDFNIRWTELFEATQSDRECNQLIKKAASQAGYKIHQKEKPFAWSEDFGRFTNRFKGAMFGLGAGENMPPLHSALYDFPDEIISTGISMFVEILQQITGFKK